MWSNIVEKIDLERDSKIFSKDLGRVMGRKRRR